MPSVEAVADTRMCEQCGGAFAPRREHARFCSAGCRAAWNREHTADPNADASALEWSITALHEVIERLTIDHGEGQAQVFAAVSEAVWWVTLVDATLVRHHHQAYEDAISARALDDRQVTEGTFAGLRFVRNRMGYHADPADFIQPDDGRPHPGPDRGRIAAWTWRSLPEPDLASLPPRGQAWEMTRYRAYQRYLARHPLGETFSQAAAFLKLASANRPAAIAASPYPAP